MDRRREDPPASAAERESHAQAARAELGWIVAALLPPLALRAVAMATLGTPPMAVDVRGLASDGAVGLVVAGAAIVLTRLGAAAAGALIALWVALCHGNFEHVLANGANAGVAYAGFLGDTTFLLGSALQVSSPIALVAVLAGTAFAARWAMRTPSVGRPLRPLALAGALAVAVALWPLDLARPDWRQANAVETNLRFGRVAPGADDPLRLAGGDGARGPGDVSGERIVPAGDRTRNVLLVILEAISGAHVPAIAEANGLAPEGGPALPRLDALARANVFYTSFVAQQRQTNRGEYALLCGDWPRLTTAVPRMSEYVADGGPPCLPELMAGLGYRTVYLQAAPLAFMMKDQFMARIGFAEVLGNASFEDARSRTNWGVDDRTLLEGALARIEALERRAEPWLLTLLTVGTHHPFNVPDDFDGGGATGLARAALQADAAVGAFVDALAARGTLDNTLVLITSDESVGVDAGADPLGALLSRNHGFLIALAPGAAPMRIDAPFLQSDLAITILDHLGEGERHVGRVGGRSAFRTPSPPRRIAFGNTYQRRVFLVDPSGTIDACDEELAACSRFHGTPGRPFVAGAAPEGPLPEPELRAARAWLAAATADRAGSRRSIEIGLLQERRVSLLFGPARFQIVYGGQGLRVPAGSTIEVELDVALRGERGHVGLRTNLVAGGQERLFHREVPRLALGERLRLRYTVDTAEPLSDVESRFVVFDREGSDLFLDFERAMLRVRPADRALEPGSAPAVVVRDFEITPARPG